MLVVLVVLVVPVARLVLAAEMLLVLMVLYSTVPTYFYLLHLPGGSARLRWVALVVLVVPVVRVVPAVPVVPIVPVALAVAMLMVLCSTLLNSTLPTYFYPSTFTYLLCLLCLPHRDST